MSLLVVDQKFDKNVKQCLTISWKDKCDDRLTIVEHLIFYLTRKQIYEYAYFHDGLDKIK
jgi:hypothetical protein